MRVILLQDVKKQGKKGDVIEVSPGYGRNFLIKNNLAKLADSAALNELKSKEKALEKQAAEELTHLQEVKKLIEQEETVVEIKAKTGEDGRLFGTIPSKQIADELEKQFDINIDKRKIQMAENLSSLGHHKVDLKLHPQVSTQIRVHIIEE